mgnify:CR=1 FL=1
MDNQGFLREVEEESGENVSACYQCYKCTNGCPVASEMDMPPHRIIRHITLGNRDKVLPSKAIWICIQCVTCSMRCPNGIDVARVFDTLRKISVKEHCEADKDTWLFDSFFLESVKKHGRLHELEAIMNYKIAKRDIFGDMKMGIGMLTKGRMGLMPHNIKDRKSLRTIIGKYKKDHDK